MAVVVEQTIPFEVSSLVPQSWNALYPLIRPTLQQIQTRKGQRILVDQSLADSKFVHIVAFGTPGRVSSHVLDNKHITAVVTETAGAGILTAQDLQHALNSLHGYENQRGVVVVRLGDKAETTAHSSDLIEVEVKNYYESDHLLQLLSSATDSCRATIHITKEMLKAYSSSQSLATSRFHTKELDGRPAINHADGSTQGYDNAKEAVGRDLKHIFGSSGTSIGDSTLSVHYCDINGLSQLENYIIAKEIAEFLQAQNLPYRLSHSTVSDPSNLARGFAISVCAVPAAYLAPQAKTIPHAASSDSDDDALRKVLSPSNARMTFNDAEIRRRIQAGCNALIKDEPAITEYDTIVGDGDCGYTLRDGAKQVLAFIEGKDLSRSPEVVESLVHDLEVNMGGTSGALYCIFLTALAASLASETSIAMALKSAMDQLMKYTNARMGDRTMMDALIPFVDALVGGSDARLAIEKARVGVEGTKTMKANLGRSAYLDDSATQGVPDPGAYGLLVLLKGMAEA